MRTSCSGLHQTGQKGFTSRVKRKILRFVQLLSEPAGEVDLRLHLWSAKKNKNKADFVFEKHARLIWAASHRAIEDIFKTRKDI